MERESVKPRIFWLKVHYNTVFTLHRCLLGPWKHIFGMFVLLVLQQFLETTICTLLFRKEKKTINLVLYQIFRNIIAHQVLSCEILHLLVVLVREYIHLSLQASLSTFSFHPFIHSSYSKTYHSPSDLATHFWGPPPQIFNTHVQTILVSSHSIPV